MGDDADAPHEWAMPLAGEPSIGDVVAAMLNSRYLATIAGGQATWIIEGDRPLQHLRP